MIGQSSRRHIGSVVIVVVADRWHCDYNDDDDQRDVRARWMRRYETALQRAELNVVWGAENPESRMQGPVEVR